VRFDSRGLVLTWDPKPCGQPPGGVLTADLALREAGPAQGPTLLVLGAAGTADAIIDLVGTRVP
jgi:hypothetical protein